nr:MAG TPA: hypothetical protein [Caudoviricetes sp.]
MAILHLTLKKHKPFSGWKKRQKKPFLLPFDK